ncbi:predicted protein [Plenodomus lingam JN3]|uniref:Predicted protein n=1 Tax=Leptosphaeria maculans (strain JN3 / isolate v23.1.3 / race Av1-4-5-6-7-8) TaxID=985895 RepID=E4ZZH4_LEPMJ|nr:predicted protein [Plenodomus lingam JN3]CBX96769.1 predicted protein [Plenodomus lingam JN3]
MVPPTDISYNPSRSNAPSSSLPEHMHGLIDLATLADMNRFLGESLSQDDLALAGWIKENFLYEPLQQTSRPVRTPEGFNKLDHAYRRVRSLTNKVQDKWPFFDQNFKAMSTSTVRNNSRGEISPGVMFQHKHGAAQVNGGNPTNASPTPELQVPFGAHQLGRNRFQRKDPVDFSEHELAPPPSKLLTPPKSSPEKVGQFTSSSSSPSLQSTTVDPTKFVGLIQYTDMIYNPSRQPSSQPEAVILDGKQIACDASHDIVPIQTDNDPERNTNDLRAAGVGSDLTALRNPNVGNIRAKSKSIMGTKARPATTPSSVSIPANSYDSMPTVQSPYNPFKTEYIENNEATGLPFLGLTLVVHDEETADVVVKPEKPRVRFSDVISEDSSSSYSLAVESDPVVSNLDRLPPKSLRRAIKRKSMSSSQTISRKRARSSKLGDASVAFGRDATIGADIAQEDEKIGVITRRSTRRSVAAENDMRTIAKIKKTKDEPDRNNEEPKFEDEDATMVDVEAERSTTGQEKLTPISSLKASKALPKVVPRSTSQPSVPEASIPVDKSASRIFAPGLQMSPTQETASSFTQVPQLHTPPSIAIDVQQTVPTKSEVGKVEYFARVHTTTGPREISISADKIKDEDKQLLKKYAVFVSKKESAVIDFDVYREIYVSANMDATKSLFCCYYNGDFWPFFFLAITKVAKVA